MESGQMLMMAQMPAGVTNPVTLAPAASPAAAPSAGEQPGSSFAGILGEMSSPDSRKPVVSVGMVISGSLKVFNTTGETAVPEQTGAKQDVIATLLATLGIGNRVTPLGEYETNVKPEEELSITAQPDVQMPQEVALSAAGAQIVLPVQLNGRMPESVQKVEQTASSVDGSSVQGQAGAVQSANSQLPAAAGDACAMEASRQMAMSGGASPTQNSALNPETMPKAGIVDATAGTGNSSSLLKHVAPEGGTPSSINRPESAVDDKPKIVPGSQSISRQGGVVVQKAEDAPVVQGPVSPAKPVTGTLNDAPPLLTVRQPEVRPALADATISTVIAANPQEQTDASAVARVVHAPQVTHPNLGVSAREAGIKRPDSQEDGTKQLTDAGTIKKGMLNEVSDFPKVVASSATEKEFMNDGDKAASDHLMNGQSNLMATHPQMKSENGAAPATASIAGQSEAVRSDVAENVVRQVKDMFANREMKQGSEQITLKLTPEKLGELTVNLKMENQQLRIEIVAENRSVKDALMQHAETLKDSLSRQNITMESFDVTTSNGQQGFGDKGWRQLAQQQFAAWAPNGGFRGAAREVNAEVLPRYDTQQQYSMLDVHF